MDAVGALESAEKDVRDFATNLDSQRAKSNEGLSSDASAKSMGRVVNKNTDQKVYALLLMDNLIYLESLKSLLKSLNLNRRSIPALF